MTPPPPRSTLFPYTTLFRSGYNDMVTAQYRLLTERLGVNHLLLVLGTSMGAMHSWMWAERYPDFMDGAVPLASRSEEHTSELQSPMYLVCRLLLEKKKRNKV